ncbi:putative E3 ubiquitin-protein ligase UNKL isoform X3 [Cygnus atratus]|uniref:putative E3 ubiquitin-protein ligase UNKL isoform X3 n=1 Tax=Cygnus atratus TaxID=8868 RepID=UPI0021B7A42F|nr:putative E3 ubiquitin-protein ligase UNKL isoform X3 [Cygnus atratus]
MSWALGGWRARRPARLLGPRRWLAGRRGPEGAASADAEGGGAIPFSASKASPRLWSVSRSMGSDHQRPWVKVLPLSLLCGGLLLWYLKEFRTEQCPLFLQHKCTQHRPFTCFHWHFLNQRRRRPIRRRDGTFNYSPDVYCTKYDETTGICPDGDDCPYLHRTTGDTERKYHLRYYKTGTCIHETDARGHCVKNGIHCAFAHGPHDIRPPVYDIRELQVQESFQNGQLGCGEGIPDLHQGILASQAMIEKILSEDPRWQDTNFVLAGYKTEQCTKPPRLCRQGYACPHYHNSRDRRRNPRKFKYRSTPCPSVKHADEWGEPSRCESGDSCQYCHSRTEQQFHPEIYKSTKCNDMRQTGYCPRGPFCAFAHVEEDTMNVVILQTGCQSKPGAHLFSTDSIGIANEWSSSLNSTNSITNNSGQSGNISCSSSPTVTSTSGSSSSLSPLGPLCRQRSLANGVLCSESSTSGVSSPTSSYPKAPGFEREDQAKQRIFSAENQQKTSEQDNKQNHLGVFSVVNPLASSITSSLASSVGSDCSSPPTVSAVSAKALPFYSGGNTIESVIGSALDLHFKDVNVASINREWEDQEGSDIGLASQRLLGSSAPVSIPGSLVRSSSLHSSSSLSTSPLSSLSQSLSQSFVSSTMVPHQQQPQPLKSEYSMLGTSASSHNSLGLNGVTGSVWDFVAGNFSPSPSPVLSIGTTLSACDAWQKEAQEAKERADVAAADKQLALQKKEEVENKLKKLKVQLAACLSTTLPYIKNSGDIEKISLPMLRSLQSRLHLDLGTIDEVIFQLQSKKCIVCREGDRSIILNPCQHYILCDHCAARQEECPCCKKSKNPRCDTSTAYIEMTYYCVT